MKLTFKKLKVLFIINDLILFPCALLTAYYVAGFGLYVFRYAFGLEKVDFLSTLSIIPLLSVTIFSLIPAFLNCFHLPYIMSVVIIFIYLWKLVKEGFLKEETKDFVKYFVVCMFGLISLESVFQVAMSI